jgi:hypothetical protein
VWRRAESARVENLRPAGMPKDTRDWRPSIAPRSRKRGG